MSNSPPDSKIAAPAQDASDYKRIRRLPSVQRANSTSLLTQALAARSNQGVEDNRPGAIASTPQSTQPSSSAQVYQTRDALNTVDGSAAERMKTVALGFKDMSLFDQRSTHTTTNYRELLNNSRVRGTSLERTVQEKRVQERPKGTYSTNPGDTALPPNFSTASGSQGLISNKTPTEGPRAQYRQWRGSRPNTPNNGSGKAWSIGVDGDDGGQVEKAVRAALAGHSRPSNRSRKASHALGFFKESLHPPAAHEAQSEDGIKALPKALLAEIRKHNITPGTDKGSSFSRSVPRMQSERRVNDANDEDDDDSDKSAENYQPENESNDDSRDVPRLNADGEEPEEEQQIFFASALFVPHQPFNDSSVREDNGSQSTTKPRLNDGRHLGSNSHQWLEEYEVPTHQVKRKYLKQEDAPGLEPSPDQQHLSDNDQGLGDNGPLSPFEDRADTATDNERTPTGSPTRVNEVPANYNRFIPEDDPSYMPADAIELVPYRHQVGGHTKIWRFSSRAVCKKLDKRENAFYENIERYHPELLDFLPRYV